MVCYCEVVITNLIPKKELFRLKINYFAPLCRIVFGVGIIYKNASFLYAKEHRRSLKSKAERKIIWHLKFVCLIPCLLK